MYGSHLGSTSSTCMVEIELVNYTPHYRKSCSITECFSSFNPAQRQKQTEDKVCHLLYKSKTAKISSTMILSVWWKNWMWNGMIHTLMVGHFFLNDILLQLDGPLAFLLKWTWLWIPLFCKSLVQEWKQWSFVCYYFGSKVMTLYIIKSY